MARPFKEHFVTDEQAEILHEHVKRNPHSHVRNKAQAVLGTVFGVTPEQTAGLLDKSPQTVRTWLAQWDKEGLACLFTGHGLNLNSSKLDARQWEEVFDTLQKSPSEVGLPGEMWNVPKLASWIRTKFEVEYTDRTYQYCLKLGGLSFIYPQKFDARRDSAQIEARMEEIRQQVAVLERDPDTVVFTSDEVKLQEEAETRKAWVRTGQRTVLEVKRGGAKQSYIGFLRKDTGACTVTELDWQNTENIVPVLEDLLASNPGKKVVVVWDNAAWHRSKELRKHLGEGNKLERLHLIWLPPYAPDHNPIERVWNAAKGNSANIQEDNFKDTKSKFVDYISGRVFNYQL